MQTISLYINSDPNAYIGMFLLSLFEIAITYDPIYRKIQTSRNQYFFTVCLVCVVWSLLGLLLGWILGIRHGLQIMLSLYGVLLGVNAALLPLSLISITKNHSELFKTNVAKFLYIFPLFLIALLHILMNYFQF